MITLVQQYFSESAKKMTEKIALSCDEKSISYSVFELFLNGFSLQLKPAGIGRCEFTPSYMVPTGRLLYTDVLPRIPNGKYDRKSALNMVFDD